MDHKKKIRKKDPYVTQHEQNQYTLNKIKNFKMMLI
jgi:hypothetical protein